MRILSRNSGFYRLADRQLLRSGPVPRLRTRPERPEFSIGPVLRPLMRPRTSPERPEFFSDRSRHWKGGKNGDSGRNKLPRTRIIRSRAPRSKSRPRGTYGVC